MNDILGWRPPQRTPAVPRFFENIPHYRQVHQFSLYGTCPSNRREEENGVKKKKVLKRSREYMYFSFGNCRETYLFFFVLTFCFDVFYLLTSDQYIARQNMRVKACKDLSSKLQAYL